MKRCKAVESASSFEEVDVRIKLDRVNDQDTDIICLPEQLFPENEDDEELLLELHEQGMCMASDMHSLYAIKARAIKTLGIWTAAGRSPFPNLPNARLEEPCHVFSLRDVLDYGESMNVSIPFSAPKRPRIAVSTVPLPPPGPAEVEDTIIRDVDLPVPSSTRGTIPLYELWYNRMCERANTDFPLPTLTEAEEALRLYSNAICLSMLSKQQSEAVEFLNLGMTDEQELLGYCLLWKAIAPGLLPLHAEKFASADIALRMKRIKLEVSKDHATLDAELDTIFKGVPRVGALLELETDFQMMPLEYKGCGALKYRCAFENAWRSVGKRRAVLSLGDAYMDAREAMRVACEMCTGPFDSYKSDTMTTFCENVLRMALSESSNGLHTLLNDDVTDWLRYSRDCIQKFVNNKGMLPGTMDPSHRSEALVQGPLCAYMLVARLHETGHLEHEDRKMLLAILLDCGHTADEAVEYILQRMSSDAKKKCKKTDLSALINSYCREKKKKIPGVLSPIKVPATRWCSAYNSGDGIPVMCPWTLYKTDEKPLRRMLADQLIYKSDDKALEQTLARQKVEDIEDILAARTKYHDFPSFACKIHYAKLWDRMDKQRGRDHSLHPSKFRVVTPHAFVTGLFPIPPAVK